MARLETEIAVLSHMWVAIQISRVSGAQIKV